MVLIGIAGSPRKEGTYYMVEKVLRASGKPYEIINLSECRINQCCGETSCLNTKKCKLDDEMLELLEKLKKSEGLVIGSPTYFSNVSGLLKVFMDRCLPLYFSESLKGKNVALVTVANIKELLEFDSNGKCKWHTEEEQSAQKCINALSTFSKHLGMNIIGSVYALHGDPSSVDKKLEELGEKFILPLKNGE